MIRNCRYTGQGFDSPRLHHLWGRTWNSTGMTMVESRLHGVATTRKLQNSNWKLQSITHGCLIRQVGVWAVLVNRNCPFFCHIPRVIATQAV